MDAAFVDFAIACDARRIEDALRLLPGVDPEAALDQIWFHERTGGADVFAALTRSDAYRDILGRIDARLAAIEFERANRHLPLLEIIAASRPEVVTADNVVACLEQACDDLRGPDFRTLCWLARRLSRRELSDFVRDMQFYPWLDTYIIGVMHAVYDATKGRHRAPRRRQ